MRRDGYATCVGELEESLFGASAPVLSEQGRPVAIVSVWGTEHRLPRERLDAAGRLALGGGRRAQGPPPVSGARRRDRARDGDVCVVWLQAPREAERALGGRRARARQGALVVGGHRRRRVVIAGEGRAFSAGADITRVRRPGSRRRSPATTARPAASTSGSPRCRSRRSPRSTATASAAGSSSRSRRISGSPTRPPCSGFPRSRSASSRARAAPCAATRLVGPAQAKELILLGGRARRASRRSRRGF